MNRHIAPPSPDDPGPRFVSPIPTRDLHAIYWTTPDAYLQRAVPSPDPALGGTVGIIVMTLVVAFVGAMLACGGVL